MGEPHPDIFQALKDAEWDNLIPEMLAFAIWLAQNSYYWRGGGLPKGKEIKDLAYDVVAKTFSGERKWDPARGTLKPWLMDQIRSEISNLYGSATHKRETHLERDAPEASTGIIEYSAVRNGVFDNVPDDPETIILAEERKKEIVNALYQAIENDEELEEIYFAILAGCEWQPRFLAAELGVPTSEINKRLKRLRRRAALVEQQLEDGNE